MRKFLVLALAASAFVSACGDDDNDDNESMSGTGGSIGDAGATATGGGGVSPTGGTTSKAGSGPGGSAAAGEGGSGDAGGESGGSGGESGSATARMFTVTIENVAAVKPFTSAGVFNTPMGDDKAGPLTPGKTYEFTVNAGRKQKLSFVTMLAATNDLFYAPKGDGIALYDDDGDPMSADVTDQIYLWDAGTEVNEEPRVGPNTVSKQAGPDTGPAENGDVVEISDTDDDFDYPEAAEVMSVTVTHLSGTEFKVSIENVSSGDALQTSEGDFPAPLSPGVWVMHNGPDPLFTVAMPDREQGLEHIAEDGNPMMLGEFVAENTGITFPASPGVWVVHASGTRPLFDENAADYGDGLEHIAEDGNPMMLGANIADAEGRIASEIFNTPFGSDAPGPITPGSRYQFSFDAKPGESLSFATMLAATNDVFFAPQDTGVPLFGANGEPLNGDITDQLYLWDAGTESNEQPGIGPTTVSNQLGPDTGNPGEESVQLLENVEDGFDYPTVDSVLRVTVDSD
jgi:hypothetical protein